MNTPPTKRQQQIYDFIAKSIRAKGYSPTVREIGAHFGISSPNGVIYSLRALEKKRLIKRAKILSRGISLVSNGVCPHCGQAIKAKR
jgi:repressor LexA